MREDQIKHMVNRFLSWKLPADFRPDAGISFKPDFNENTPFPMKHEPSGTNLFSATQAEAMVRHLTEGVPDISADILDILHECVEYFDNRADADCDQDGFIPNTEMTLLSKVREVISNFDRNVSHRGNTHVHPILQSVLATFAPENVERE